MNTAKEKIAAAYKWAMANRPTVNGYPVLAEALRQSGVIRYVYNLPSCQSMYHTKDGAVASVQEPLFGGMGDVPKFNKDNFIKVLRATQLGETTFPEFLKGSWEAGVIGYSADLVARKVTYYGSNGESYIEDYPAVEVKM